METTEVIIKELSPQKVLGPTDLASAKRRLAKELGLPCPKNSVLLQTYHKLVATGRTSQSPALENALRTRPVRSLSGVVNVSVLTKAFPCPAHCAFCPTERGLPKSYLSGEPAVERAKRRRFHPYLQVQERLASLERQGHNIGKIDLRVIGSTWSAYPKNYQTWFIKECFRAANDYGTKSKFQSTKSKQIPKPKIQNLEQLQQLNEKARCRIIGLAIETRPDYLNGKEIRRLRELGVTKVEMGVQTLDDEILKTNFRGHGIGAVAEATRQLKDAGFKVSFQMMLNLPGATPKKDWQSFRLLFDDERFRPDFLKIYPCALLPETLVYRWYLAGQYRPYSLKVLVELLQRIKKDVPPYVRIERIVRDIPSQRVAAGPAKVSNLREVVKKKMAEKGWECLCIRCREAKENTAPESELQLQRRDYWASAGREIFLSLEDKGGRRLYALLRLRLSESGTAGPLAVFPALRRAALIRELHVYGQALSFGQRSRNSNQHQSLGKRLMATAEKIAASQGFRKIAVIAGVGTRGYYRRLGYRLQDTYLVKRL